MKRILFAFCVVLMGALAHAACPDGYEEIQMENTILTSDACPSGQASYYQINEMCTGNLY